MDLKDFLDLDGEDIQRETKIMKQTGVFGILIESEAPVVVCDCMAYIREKGLFNVGLFRVNGNNDRIELIKQSYTKYYNEKEAAEKVDFDVLGNFEKDDELSVNDVASLLKNYFMKLEEPLIPYKSYEKFCEAYSKHMDDDENDGLIKDFNKVLHDIFSPNRECLCLVISFLREVATFADHNKMTVENLAKIWCMSLMRGKSAAEDMKRLGVATGALESLIACNVHLYMPSVKTVQQNTKYKSQAPVPPPTKAQEKAAERKTQNGAPPNSRKPPPLPTRAKAKDDI